MNINNLGNWNNSNPFLLSNYFILAPKNMKKKINELTNYFNSTLKFIGTLSALYKGKEPIERILSNLKALLEKIQDHFISFCRGVNVKNLYREVVLRIKDELSQTDMCCTYQISIVLKSISNIGFPDLTSIQNSLTNIKDRLTILEMDLEKYFPGVEMSNSSLGDGKVQWLLFPSARFQCALSWLKFISNIISRMNDPNIHYRRF